MIGDLGSYSVRNFISFVDEVYFRLFERQFEAWWPAPLLVLAIGVATLVLAWLGKARLVAILLGPPLASSAITFHFLLYAELTPVGRVFGWAFLIQVPLILLWGFVTKPTGKIRVSVPTISGAAIAFFALAIYPLLILFTERNKTGVEIFGMAPDPTVAFVLGILLMSARPLWLLLLFPIPLLWAAVSGATLDALEAPFAMVLPSLAGIAVFAAIWKAVFRAPDASP